MRKNPRIIHNYSELESLHDEQIQNQSCLFQEYVSGKTIGVEILANNGGIIDYFFHERVHQPLGIGGGSSLRKSIPGIKQLYDHVEKFCEATNYTGVGMFEFLYNEEGHTHLIEVNGRFWGSLPLSLVSGVDFPYHLYLMLTHQESRIKKSDYKVGIFCRNTSWDVGWWISNIKSRLNNKTPERYSEPIWHFLLGINKFITLKEHNDTLVMDDPWPGLYELSYLFSRVLKEALIITRLFFLQNVSRKYCKEKFVKQFNASKNIMFVCNGNINRSVFAEKYLQSIQERQSSDLNEKVFSSSGILENSGRAVSNELKKYAQEIHLNLDSYRSRKISDIYLDAIQMLITFDLVCFDKLKKYPQLADKVFLLGCLGNQKSIIIEDPVGKSYSEHQKVFMDIKKIMDANFCKNRKD